MERRRRQAKEKDWRRRPEKDETVREAVSVESKPRERERDLPRRGKAEREEEAAETK